MSNDALDDIREEKRYKQLADYLAISVDDLQKLDPQYEEDSSSDGALYGYIVSFPDYAPAEILSKVKGLDLGGRSIHVDSHIFDLDN